MQPWNERRALCPQAWPGRRRAYRLHRCQSLDANGRIDAADLMPFSEYWLERTDCAKPAVDPNGLSAGDP